MKWCNYCKQEKPPTAFNLKYPKLDNDILQAYCKECNAKKNKEWYQLHKSEHKKRVYAERKIEREQVRQYVNLIKTAPCSDCNNTFPPYVMDFDHRDPSKKKENVASMTTNYSLTMVKEEIAKCDLVCANCHRIRTHG